MKRKTLLAFLMLTPTLLLAQELQVRNSFYVEALGNGITYSLNYERFIASGQLTALAVRGGLSVQRYDYVVNNYFTFCTPFEVNTLFHQKNEHMIELGIGCTPFLAHKEYQDIFGNSRAYKEYEFRYIFSGRIGYRYQPYERGFMCRIAMVPLFTQSTQGPLNEINLWFGVSAGYSF